MTPSGDTQFFCTRKTDFPKRQLFVTKIHFSSWYLFTLSFIFGLRLNYLILYWKNFVKHYTNVVIGGHKYNIWKKLDREISESKWLFKTNLSYLAVLSSTTSSHVLVPFQQYGYSKKAPQIFSTFFPCIFFEKTKWNSLQILKNKNIVKTHSLN